MGHFLLIADNPDQSYQQAEGLLQGMMDAEPQEKDILIKNPATEPFQKQSRPLGTPA